MKTGERLRLGVVEAPDPDWAPRLLPFLAHKPPEFRHHFQRALVEPLDELRTLFYVGELDDRLVTQVMIVAARGAGILGHVYTLPAERRKGAYSLLMAAQMADTARAGLRLLTLATGFDSPPYWIYHARGFRGIGPGRGQMIWRAAPGVEAELFAPAATQVRPLRWDDWPWMDLLGMQPLAPAESLPRSWHLGLKEQGSLEGPYVAFQVRREREPAIQALALQSAGGATAGFALLAPGRHWFRDLWTVDLYAHPSFTVQRDALLAALAWPDAPCAALRTPGEAELWEGAGFRRTGTLPAWIERAGRRADLEVWLHGAAR